MRHYLRDPLVPQRADSVGSFCNCHGSPLHDRQLVRAHEGQLQQIFERREQDLA